MRQPMPNRGRVKLTHCKRDKHQSRAVGERSPFNICLPGPRLDKPASICFVSVLIRQRLAAVLDESVKRPASTSERYDWRERGEIQQRASAGRRYPSGERAHFHHLWHEPDRSIISPADVQFRVLGVRSQRVISVACAGRPDCEDNGSEDNRCEQLPTAGTAGSTARNPGSGQSAIGP